ncbi:hypothetical protein DCCM_4393 [Desulfocucumis palustris]|uniref:Uncharacterized protein n=1 Tax=Desulfocucumis palustris TaxID=1898651 RepID=A0A2L2XGK9_9FIRM|nr:hypothetical protein DCCM_4393 [Desulfocucumis palustris]
MLNKPCQRVRRQFLKSLGQSYGAARQKRCRGNLRGLEPWEFDRASNRKPGVALN